jgi:hypothetical protein
VGLFCRKLSEAMGDSVSAPLCRFCPEKAMWFIYALWPCNLSEIYQAYDPDEKPAGYACSKHLAVELNVVLNRWVNWTPPNEVMVRKV